MTKKTKDEIVEEMYEHGVQMGFINGWKEPKPVKKKPNNKK